MEKLMTFVKDKWPILIAWNVVIVLLLFAFGCEPETDSLLDPNKKVTTIQLQNEIDYLIRQSETRFADLERQAELRQFVLNQSLLIAETGTVNPIGLITSLIAIMGIGAGADDIRLRRQRAKTPFYVKGPGT